MRRGSSGGMITRDSGGAERGGGGRKKMERQKEGLVGSKNSLEFAMGQGYQEFRCPALSFLLFLSCSISSFLLCANLELKERKRKHLALNRPPWLRKMNK
ncbi:hypothetical protein AVEN_193069-1 [Araneus ventricosus]|uniref:Uncharacterized protein n=1 Tax=Araneus ventricosus TaxID=182803 RepID=A0A4Y2B2N2_ARAVE|nr:hypothetical protein AVEN_193069-1 [Araneus ventricosus]